MYCMPMQYFFSIAWDLNPSSSTIKKCINLKKSCSTTKKKKKGISVKISQMALSSPPPLSDSSLFANSPKPPIEPLLQPISTENNPNPMGWLCNLTQKEHAFYFTSLLWLRLTFFFFVLFSSFSVWMDYSCIKEQKILTKNKKPTISGAYSIFAHMICPIGPRRWIEILLQYFLRAE